jgi:hypothetical protein
LLDWWLRGRRSPNRPRRRAKNRRRVVRHRRQRLREALVKRRRTPWRWKRARSCLMPAVQILLRQQCRAAANPWKSARNARRIRNPGNVGAIPFAANAQNEPRSGPVGAAVGVVDGVVGGVTGPGTILAAACWPSSVPTKSPLHELLRKSLGWAVWTGRTEKSATVVTR